MASIDSKIKPQSGSMGLNFSQVAISTGLLALGCLPTRRLQWELYHQTIWRKLHWLLTGATLVGFGFALPLLRGTIKPSYICAVSFFVIEFITEQCRRTTIDVDVEAMNGYHRIKAPSSQRACNAGVFYYIRGKPFPASSCTDNCKNILIVPSSEFDKGPDKCVQVEGPYGPSIGILWWMGYWISQSIRSIIGSSSRQPQERRPPQLITQRHFYFVVDETAIARTFPLWLWLQKNTEYAALYHCNLSSSDSNAYQDLILKTFGNHTDEASAPGRNKTEDESRFSRFDYRLRKPENPIPGTGLQIAVSDSRYPTVLQRLQCDSEAPIANNCVIAGSTFIPFVSFNLHN